MRALVYASCLTIALVAAGPALAQSDAAPSSKAKHAARISQPFPSPSGFVKYCGAYFGCYTGIRLQCAADTRPYQDIANHQCFCLPDGCR